MATGINKVILLGNLGSEPELKYIPNTEKAVLNISLCTDDSYYDKQNDRNVEQTDWHSLVFFGRKAEIVAQQCHKGDNLYIEGKSKTRSYEKDGITRYVTEIHVSEFKHTYGSGTARNRTTHSQAPAAAPAQPAYGQAPKPAQVIGHFDAQGAAMPPHIAKPYIDAGYTEGWPQFSMPPILMSQPAQ